MALVNAAWTTLGLEFGVGTVGIVLVFRWLLLNTRDGGDGGTRPRRDFVRRFCMLVVTIDTTAGSYSVGVALAGLAPLLGVVALVFFWGRVVPQTTEGKAMTAAA